MVSELVSEGNEYSPQKLRKIRFCLNGITYLIQQKVEKTGGSMEEGKLAIENVVSLMCSLLVVENKTEITLFQIRSMF